MHEAMQQFFDEHRKPTHCSHRQVHDMALPLLTLATQAQQQVALYRQRLMSAKLVDHDQELDGKLERLKQTLSVLDAALPAFLEAGERVADAFSQWDRIVTEDATMINAWSVRKATAAAEQIPSAAPEAEL